MAYPFTSLPSFGEFREILQTRFQCAYKSLENTRYLEREIGDQIIQCVVDLDDSKILLPSMIRNICRRLSIKPEDLDIGFHLG